MEIESVRRADLTFCVSLHRAEELRRSVPEAAERIHHLPHGVPREWLAPESIAGPAPAPDRIARLPRPLIGYIGSLEDRVDWALLDRIAEAFGEASIVLVGDHSPMQPGGETPRDRCLARPNVHAIGRCEQSEVPAFNRSFDVALIPYLVEHPFNIACCPTKIMDTFAAARPLVSTALPECLLHRERMTIADDDAGFVAAIERILAAGSSDGLDSARFDWAAGHTCDLVVSELLDAAEAILFGRSPRASQ
jgi:glycosyltransferase involved in cell wall biosynthesis